jgi:hypothetical protein
MHLWGGVNRRVITLYGVPVNYNYHNTNSEHCISEQRAVGVEYLAPTAVECRQYRSPTTVSHNDICFEFHGT